MLVASIRPSYSSFHYRLLPASLFSTLFASMPASQPSAKLGACTDCRNTTGSIRALHGWGRSYFEFIDGHRHLDADAAILSTHSSLLQRGRSRLRGGSSGGNRKHRNMQKGMCESQDACVPSGDSNEMMTNPAETENPPSEPTYPDGDSDSQGSPPMTPPAPTSDPSDSEGTGDLASDVSNTTNTIDTMSASDAAKAAVVASATSSPPTQQPPLTTQPPTSPEVSSQAALTNSRGTNTGAIIGGVIGGVAFLLLLALLTFLFLRRRKRKRTPASAEFRDRYVPRSTPPFSSQSRAPLATQTSMDNLYLGDNEAGEPDPPPPFTQGNFNDPLFEKIYETQKAHVEYGLAR